MTYPIHQIRKLNTALMVVLVCLFSNQISAEPSPHFYFYLEDEPVYTSNSSESPGFMSEVSALLLDDLGASAESVYLPWKRAQMMAMDRPNAVIFPLTRNLAREENYLWVCKIIEVPVAFVSLQKDSLQVLSGYDEAVGVRGIGVIQGTPQESRLRELEIDHIAFTGKDLYQALYEKKVNYVYTAIPEAVVAWKVAGYESKLKFGPALQSLPLWIAASKHSTQVDKQQWLQSLDKIKETGEFGKIYSKYFGEQYTEITQHKTP